MCTRRSSAPIEVVTDRWARSRSRRGFIIHESGSILPADRTETAGVPTTSVVRTLLDLPAVSHPFRMEQALEDALRKRLCTVDQLVQRFVQLARRGRAGVTVTRQLLEERTGSYVPTGSVLEMKTLELIESLSLPAPVRQFPVTIGDTRVFLDLAWPDRLLAVECDGMWSHGTNVALPWDADRQNRLQLLGWFVLRVSWHGLTRNPDAVVTELRQAFRRCAPRS